jgi:folate-binding protein YgfZ
MAPGSGTEALVLDLNGRVEHHVVLSDVDGTVWMDTEPERVGPLAEYLVAMRFWSDVAPADVSGDWAVLTVVGPATPDVLTAAGLPVPAGRYASVALDGAGGGIVRRMPWPGNDAADLIVPRAEQRGWWSRLVEAGAAPAGTMAYEAMRAEALRPRLGVDTDERTIPHEVGWIGSAVHLAKGCYRGQETVARVANLGRPPRRLVLLHFDEGDAQLPVTGDPVLLGERTIGRVGTVAQHHELGPIALALLKRSVPVDAELVAGVDERATPARIDPDSVPPEADAAPPGRAAQMRGGLR